MNDNSEFDQLDKLLAQPAMIADRGFTEQVDQSFRKLKTSRRSIFLVAGLCWFALMIAVVSPQALYEDLLTMVMTLDAVGTFTYLLEQYQTFDTSKLQASYTSIAAIVFSVAAVISMLVRV